MYTSIKCDLIKSSFPCIDHKRNFDLYLYLFQLIEKKLDNFTSTAQRMISDSHYDSVHINREIDLLNNKWTTFHTSVRDYRTMLDTSVVYYELYEEVSLVQNYFSWLMTINILLFTDGSFLNITSYDYFDHSETVII